MKGICKTKTGRYISQNQNVLRTNGRNVKQLKAQKTNKKVAKGSNELTDGWKQL